MSEIDQAIDFVKTEIDCFRNPGGYMDREYYIRCEAKVDILEDVLYRLEKIKKGE